MRVYAVPSDVNELEHIQGDPRTAQKLFLPRGDQIDSDDLAWGGEVIHSILILGSGGSGEPEISIDGCR